MSLSIPSTSITNGVYKITNVAYPDQVATLLESLLVERPAPLGDKTMMTLPPRLRHEHAQLLRLAPQRTLPRVDAHIRRLV
jgi:hypothetical protein